MNRQKGDKDLFPQGNIGEEAMLAYLRGELTDEEKQQFEKLLKEDPFAQEALEGLQNIPAQEDISHSFHTIKKKVREKSSGKEAKGVQLRWPIYAWAASVFGLLIGIGFLMINYIDMKSPEIAQNTQNKKDTEVSIVQGKTEEPTLIAAPSADSLNGNTATTEESGSGEVGTTADIPSANKMNDQKEKSEQFALKKPEPVKALPPVTVGENNAENANQAPVIANSALSANNNNAGMTSLPATGAVTRGEEVDKDFLEKKAAEIKEVAANKASSKKEEKAARAKTKSNGTAATLSDLKAASEENTRRVSIDDAMQSFNAGDYKKSSGQFDEVLKKDPNNTDALYFGGISDYIEGNTTKSEKNFDKLLKGGTRYVEGSKWYKANILLQKDKKTEAKKLLQDLAGTNSSYKERAVKKLAEMDF